MKVSEVRLGQQKYTVAQTASSGWRTEFNVHQGSFLRDISFVNSVCSRSLAAVRSCIGRDRLMAFLNFFRREKFADDAMNRRQTLLHGAF